MLARMSFRRRRLLPVLASWLAVSVAACSTPPRPEEGLARTVREKQRWDVQHAGQPLGSLVLLELDDAAGTQRFYRVENRSQQWLGFVSDAGGVYRRVPFAEREEFLGVYPMAEGLALLYDVERVTIEAPAAAREASASRPAAGTAR